MGVTHRTLVSLAELRVVIVLVRRVRIEPTTSAGFDPMTDSADVLVEMENNEVWQAHFVTLAHLRQEMQLSLDVALQHDRALAATQFTALETPHVVVERLTEDVIEDVVDNLMALGIFESVFNLFHPEPEREELLAWLERDLEGLA